MKINNIKINSYGNIHDKEMKFTDGINIIKGKNESGKSTILNYIVSMFYGISKNKDGNKLSDYEKYKPWRGEEFSGKIEYNLDSGEKFEVFRDFNKKNPQIYNENYENISDKYNVNKKDGNQFFLMQTNVEKPMYLSTVVSTQQDVRLDEKNQNMLVQKITNLAGTGEDNVSYKKAVTKLQEKIRDEIGTSKTSLKPINIAQNQLNNIEMEIKKIEPYENEKYSIDEEKNKAKKEVESLENEKKLAVDLKAIYEEQNTTIQELELKKKDKTDNLYNLNILQDKEKTYEKSKEEILKNLQEADEIKKAKEAELENLVEKEEPKKSENNSVFFIIELLLIILLILNVFFIKLNVINICSAVVILLTFVIHIIKVSQIKNKNKKILAENARKLEQQRESLARKIQEVDSDIQLLQNEEKSNNEELSMAKGKIELLAKKINEEIASIGDMEEKLKNNLNTSKKILEEKYNQLQKALEKEDGYVVDDQLSYKEDEAEGLKYTQCIEKNTNSSYEIYSKAVYYNEDSAKSSESQWNETKTTSDGKTVGITYNEEKEATYYYYRDGNVIISAGGYGANDQVLNNLKKYYSLEIQ